MQLQPRYGAEPVLLVDTSLTDVATPLIRQRRRFADLLAGLADDQWSAPSRCDGWSAQDVVAHLVTTNQFWDFSMRAGLAETPTRVLANFDPVASPAQMVEQVRSRTPAETLAQFIDSNNGFLETVAAIGAHQWSSTLAEAPPGHVALRAVALHALWDSWVHERDIVLPLGLDPVEEPDEIIGSLQYAAALSPTFLATNGSVRPGHVSVRATDPDTVFVVEVGATVTVTDGAGPDGALVLRGPAVELTEVLSLRRPLGQPIDASDRWLLEGLAEVFVVAS